jgi:hypothetical protein
MDEMFSSWPNLTDQPISHSDDEYFMDCSSFAKKAHVLPGYAVVTLDAVIEEWPLPVGTSAQKAELIALIWVLHLTAAV